MSRISTISQIMGICLVMSISGLAQAAPDAAPIREVTLTELIQLALKSHPQIDVSRQTEQAARQRLQSARSFPNPTLELVPRLAGNRDAADSEIIVSQPIDLFGKRRAQAKLQKAKLREAQAKSTFAKRELILQVKQAAINLFAAQDAESLNNVQVKIAQKFHQAAARRVELGDAPPVQLQRAKLELSRAQNELANAQSTRLRQLAILNQLVGQSPETEMRVLFPEFSTSNLPAKRDQFLSNALANRPDLQMELAKLDALEAQVDVIRRERLPKLALQARRNSFFGDDGSYGVRAVITMPLFDFGSISHERRAAQAEAKAQESRIALLQSQVSSQLQQAILQWKQQGKNVQLYRTEIVPETEDLLRKTQIGYDQGASSYLEVLEAQRTFRQVQTEYQQAIAAAFRSKSALERALGTALPTDIKNTDAQTEPLKP